MNSLRVPPRGIKSLNDRIATLEESKEVDDNLISRLQKAEKQRKQRELDKLNESFSSALSENVTDLDKSNLMEIMVFAVKFVRQNITNIARLCNIRASDEFETMATVSFLSFLYPDQDVKFLEMSASTLRKIMYTPPHMEEVTTIPTIPVFPQNNTPKPTIKAESTIDKKKFQLFRRNSNVGRK